MCRAMALAQGLAYAAVQARTYCFGGTDISNYTITGTCTSVCGGDPSTVCGGLCANAIFTLGESGQGPSWS